MYDGLTKKEVHLPCSGPKMHGFAQCPQSIADTGELRRFRQHMRGCRDCRESVLAALEFDRAFLAPLAKDRPHLTHTEFVALRDSGFDTERQEPQTPAEWHLALCERCKAALKENL